MEFESAYQMLRSFWLVLLVVLFIGIVAWVFWPRHKKRLERHGRIPLDEDD